MKKLAYILRQLINEQAITASELARRTGIGQPVLHRLISGATLDPKLSTLSAVAHYFALTISQLIGDEPLPKNRQNKSYHCKIPLLNWDQILEWPKNKLQFNELTYLMTDARISQNSYALVIKDSTMQPLFPEKTLLIVDPALSAVESDYVIVHLPLRQEIVFRQWLTNGQQFYIKPLNPNFKMQVMRKKDRVLGVVVQTRADHK